MNADEKYEEEEKVLKVAPMCSTPGSSPAKSPKAPPAMLPGTGLYGVLDPDLEKSRKGANISTTAPAMKIEVMEGRATGLMMSAIWIAFITSMLYIWKSQEQKHINVGTYPPAAAAEAFGVSKSNLIGVANYQPFVDANETELFTFNGAVTVLPSDISSSSSSGGNLTAIQWLGKSQPDRWVTVSGTTLIWRVEYVDANGMQLSGDSVLYEVWAFACWVDCDIAGNWHEIFAEDTDVFAHAIEIKSVNAAGQPTEIHWQVVAYQEFYPFRDNLCFAIRYLNDPGDTAAGYRVFEENDAGYFGSCDSASVEEGSSQACLRLRTEYVKNADVLKRNLALACLCFTLVTTAAWIVMLKRSLKGWRMWNLQQRWTLLMALGVVLFQNPVQTIWVLVENTADMPAANRAFESITVAGFATILLVAGFWADSARYRVLSAPEFYLPKCLYIGLCYLSVYIGLIALYPVNNEPGDFWGLSAWSWDDSRSAMFVIAEATRLFLWLMGGFYYYYFLHCSFKFYNKIPYMLTRAEQLSFRFVSSTFSFFVFLTVARVAGRFITATILMVNDTNPEASGWQQSSAFFKYMYGQTLRSPFTMVFLAVAVFVFQFAFLPASALQLSKYKPRYVRLERDVLRGNWQRRRRSYFGSFRASFMASSSADPSQNRPHTPAPSTAGAMAGAAAAAASAAAAAGHAAGTAAARVAETATVAAGGQNTGIGSAIAAAMAPERPAFVVERASWLVSLSREAYRCFTAEELEMRVGDRLVDAAQFGCEVVALITEDPDYNLHDTHCIIMRHRVTRRLIVSFRGTISRKQMKTDLQGFRCSVNLDLFALRVKGNKCCFPSYADAEVERPANQAGTAAAAVAAATAAAAPLEKGALGALPEGELETGDEEAQVELATAAYDADSPATPPRLAKDKGAHMAFEDDLPDYLLHLASAMKLDVDAVRSRHSRARSASGGASRSGKSGSSMRQRSTIGDVSEVEVERDVSELSGPEALEKSRMTAPISDGMENVAAAATKTAARASLAAGAAYKTATDAASALREQAAAVHKRRLESKKRKASRGKIHFGFWSSYSTVRERVLDVVQRELLREPGQVYVTGHSLGGALATLCSYDMSLWLLPVINAWLGRTAATSGDEHEEEIRITMYNYGSPRVGDFWFSQRFNAKVPHAYRVVCDGDIITSLPPARFGYVHVGALAVVDRSGCGSVLIDPSKLEASLQLRATTNVKAHLFGPYMAAMEGCLYPLETQEELQSVIETVFRGRRGGEWYGCCAFWLCCDARLPRWLGVRAFASGATKAVGGHEDSDDESTDDEKSDAEDSLDAAPENRGKGTAVDPDVAAGVRGVGLNAVRQAVAPLPAH